MSEILDKEIIKKMVKDFKETFPLSTIKLAGSYCSLFIEGKQPTLSSDVDILIIGEADKKEIAMMKGYWEYKTGKEIDIHHSPTGKFVGRYGIFELEKTCDINE